MWKILITLGIVLTTILTTAVLALFVFAPPAVDLFRPAGPGSENKQIRGVSFQSVEYSYPLYFVEFDDEGFYADHGQKDAVLDAVEASITEEKEGSASGTIILLYVHGLNHSARDGDDNVSCFGELLDAVAMMQRPRNVNVVGVYIGWPGLVYDNSNLNAVIAYLGREAAADRIAERGDLLDLFTNIGRVRYESESPHTRFVIIGHSLGGRAAYLALRPLMQRSMDKGFSDIRERTADVTVFANPAFSAVEHSSLRRIMAAVEPTAKSFPRFILLTSEADEVLLGAFQASQKFTSFFRGDYTLNDGLRWTAAGQYPEYLTHDLRLEDGEYANPEGDGPCPRLSASELEIIKGRTRAQSEAELYDFSGVSEISCVSRFINRSSRNALRSVSQIAPWPDARRSAAGSI